MPSVSLVIPCYNHQAVLERAVVSGLRQSFLQEVIIVDDHSTDASFELAQQLATTDTRIKLAKTSSNSGPGVARNCGSKIATGDYLSFLDADDELLGDFFKEALDILESRQDMHVVKSEVEFIDPVKGYILPVWDPRHASAILSACWGMVMRKKVFDRIGGFPESTVFRGPRGGEDVAFMSALIEHFEPIGRVDRPSYRCWSQAGSHLDKFLANTRLDGNGFEFVSIHPDQASGGLLEESVSNYLKAVAKRLRADKNN